MMRKIVSLLVGTLAATPLAAQGLLTVTVRDSTGAVVPNATVTVIENGVRQMRTTTDSGRARLVIGPDARLQVLVRRLGFAPVETGLHVSTGSASLDVVLARTVAATLADVSVTARRRSVSGIVVGTATQEPLAGAEVWLDAGPAAVTGADGLFDLDLGDRTTAIVRVRARDHEQAMRIERVDPDSTLALFITLDSASRDGSLRKVALFDAESRIAMRRARDLLVSGRELRGTGRPRLFDAIMAAPSVRERELFLNPMGAEIYHNGRTLLPTGFLPSSPEGVLFVELYTGDRADRSRSSARFDRAPETTGSLALNEEIAARPYGGLTKAISYIVVWTR